MKKWTPEEEERLRRLWGAGLSASKIAKILGRPTRNSVIGKLHRLGLIGKRRGPSDPSGSLPSGRAFGGGAGAPTVFDRDEKVTVAASLKLQRDYSRPLIEAPTIVEALMLLPPGGCKWVYRKETDGSTGYCGRPRRPGIPYCRYHAGRAYENWHDT